MTEREQSFILEALKPYNLKIVRGFTALIVTVILTGAGLYYGLKAEIQMDKVEGNHKDEMQDVRMTGIENNMALKAWRSEVDNLRQRIELTERVNETLRK